MLTKAPFPAKPYIVYARPVEVFEVPIRGPEPAKRSYAGLAIWTGILLFVACFWSLVYTS